MYLVHQANQKDIFIHVVYAVLSLNKGRPNYNMGVH